MKSKLLHLTVFYLCFSLVLNAANKTWNGSSSSNWATAANWSPSGVPGTGDNIIIPASLARYPILDQDRVVVKFTMNGGSLNGNGFELFTNGDLTVFNGTMNFNGASIYVSNSSDMFIYGGTVNVNGADLYVEDALTVEGGNLNISNSDLIVNNDIVLSVGTINLNSNALSVDNNLYLKGAGFVSPGPIFTDNLIVDFSGTQTLNYSILIRDNAQFNNGILISSLTNLVYFDNDATVSSVSNASHVKGPVRKEIGVGTTNTFSFPVGDGSVYAEIEISGYQQERNQDYFTATYYNVISPNAAGTLANTLDHISQTEYWTLDRGANSGTPTTDVRVRLSYNASERSGTIDNSTQLRVARWNGSQWVDHGRASVTGNNASGSLRTNNQVTSFSPFTLGSTSSLNPLPIELINFTAKQTSGFVKIDWTTVYEINNDFFTVEKSSDGRTWTEIGTVKSAGNMAGIQEYTLNDMKIQSGIAYYRLKQTDLNSEYAYSKTVLVNFQPKLQIILFPNPVADVLGVSLASNEEQELQYTILDMNGRQIDSKLLMVNGEFSIDLRNYEAGIYCIILQVNGDSQSYNFLKK